LPETIPFLTGDLPLASFNKGHFWLAKTFRKLNPKDKDSTTSSFQLGQITAKK
jgi:hypothetical protein